jgi:hypothetical protein
MGVKYEKVTKYVAELYGHLPHLPLNLRKWLTSNMWWIVLIGAIIGGFGVLCLVLITLLGGIFLAGAVFLFSAKFGGLALLIAVIIVALLIANVVIAIMAINPLKLRMKRGWDLLTVSLVLIFTAAVLTDISKQDSIAIINDIFWLAVSGYFLFEIRSFFMSSSPAGTVPDMAPSFHPPANIHTKE